LDEIEKNEGDIEKSLKKSFLRLDQLMLTSQGADELKKFTNLSNKFDEVIIKSLPGAIQTEEGYVNKHIEIFKELFDPRSQDKCEISMFTGTTACVCVIIKDKIYLANSGDSRAILIRDESVYLKTTDHKPENEIEKKRIVNADGRIIDSRVKGSLNLTRSIGDLDYKSNKYLSPEDQIITANPDIYIENCSNCDFIVIACDGIWDSKNNDKVTKFVASRIKEKPLLGIIEELLDDCLSKDPLNSNCTGSDNMSCILIELKGKCN
jgi:protein phosphatase 1G